MKDLSWSTNGEIALDLTREGLTQLNASRLAGSAGKASILLDYCQAGVFELWVPGGAVACGCENPAKGRACGMIVELGPDDFIVMGTGFDVKFRELDGPLREAQLISIEEGTFQGEHDVLERAFQLQPIS
jgi:hypothetical protein